MTRQDYSELRVMIVDDSWFFKELMRVMLRAFGVERIYYAPDATAALKTLSWCKIDILYVDCLMSDMDGIELVSTIRHDHKLPCRGMAITCITAHAVHAMVQAAVKCGADGFLAKPVSAKDLYANIVWQVDQPLPRVSQGCYYGPDRNRNVSNTYIPSQRRARSLAPIEVFAPGSYGRTPATGSRGQHA